MPVNRRQLEKLAYVIDALYLEAMHSPTMKKQAKEDLRSGHLIKNASNEDDDDFEDYKSHEGEEDEESIDFDGMESDLYGDEDAYDSTFKKVLRKEHGVEDEYESESEDEDSMLPERLKGHVANLYGRPRKLDVELGEILEPYVSYSRR